MELTNEQILMIMRSYDENDVWHQYAVIYGSIFCESCLADLLPFSDDLVAYAEEAKKQGWKIVPDNMTEAAALSACEWKVFCPKCKLAKKT